MNKISKTFLSIIIFGACSFIFASEAHADLIIDSPPVPGAPKELDLLIVGGVFVGVITVISWLVTLGIRAIRKKKNVISK